MNKKIVLVVIAVVAAGLGFWAGSSYGASSTSVAGMRVPGQFGGQIGGVRVRTGMGAGGGLVSGDILSKDANSITVKVQDGGSKIVFFSGSTAIGKIATGSASDLSVGKRVTVSGTTNTDGSVTASTIQLRPETAVNSPVSANSAVKEFAVTGSNFSFAPSTMTVKKGDRVKITFTDAGGNHDLRIDEFGVATKVLKAGGSETVEFTADKTGSFEYYCSVGSHRAMGMKGTLTVQ